MAGPRSSGASRSNESPAVTAPVSNHASSCHRSRATRLAGVSAPSWRQHRVSRSPCSVSASTTTRVQLEAERVEVGEQPVGEHLGRERGLVDAHRRRIELDGLGQLLGRDGGHRVVLHLAAGPPVRVGAGWSETAEHRRLGQRRERAEGAQPETGEQVDELTPTSVHRVERTRQHRHRPRREERRGLPRRDHQHVGPALLRPARGEAGRERARGDADPHVVHPDVAHEGDDARREGVVTAEVARRPARRERQLPRAFEHQPRDQLLHRADHELEGARVGGVVGVEHHEPRAARASASRRRSPTATPSARASADALADHQPPRPPVRHHDRHPDQAGVVAAGRRRRASPGTTARTSAGVPAPAPTRPGRARRSADGPPRPGPPPPPGAGGR